MTPQPTCGGCRFWKATKYIAVDGECRRRAPTGIHPKHPWPDSDEDDWCGEFEAKKEETK